MKRVSLSILFLALLLLSSTAFARIPYENNKDADKKDARGEVVKDCTYCVAIGRCCPYFCCTNRCCSKEEYDEFLKGTSVPHN